MDHNDQYLGGISKPKCESAASTCVHFSSGQWSTSHYLTIGRSSHTSWVNENGLHLIGGGWSYSATELLAVTDAQEGKGGQVARFEDKDFDS